MIVCRLRKNQDQAVRRNWLSGWCQRLGDGKVSLGPRISAAQLTPLWRYFASPQSRNLRPTSRGERFNRVWDAMHQWQVEDMLKALGAPYAIIKPALVFGAGRSAAQ